MANYNHDHWMQQAIELAEKAANQQEVPVGAVVIKDDKIIGRGYNQPISHCDPTAHAEINALRNAGKTINNYRLTDCTLYVTLEPCTMCVGAIIHARIKHLVFGALEPKAGAVVSQNCQLNLPYYNHQVSFESLVLADQCSQLLSEFFKQRRASKKTRADQ